ncbi:SANT/Myb_domain [Hexamita inflata]|uniref:SANT/Myb domain n=1 Tax=Hexamita inflata TaxID=28002 RepID=A0AA86V3G7_9EUKA|nr:SANT/Myb domain [Hexamita inflata]
MTRLVSRWTQEETKMLNSLVTRFKKNFRRVADHFPGRTYSQIRSHFYNQIYRSERDSFKDSRSHPTPVQQQEAQQQEVSFYYFTELFE